MDVTNPPLVIGVPIGGLIDWPGSAPVPTRWLELAAQSLLRATYGDLFAALNRLVATVTATSASPGVFTTASAHGLAIGDPVFFETTGTLPAPLNPDVIRYVMTVPSGTTFTLGSAVTDSPTLGTRVISSAVNTTTTGTGTHRVWASPYGIADATHFSLPDGAGRTTVGQVRGGAGLAYTVLGFVGGESAHLLLGTEAAQKALASGALQGDYTLASAAGSTGGGTVAQAGTGNAYNLNRALAAQDSANAHNTMQPSLVTRKIIYTGIPQ